MLIHIKYLIFCINQGKKMKKKNEPEVVTSFKTQVSIRIHEKGTQVNPPI
jgi:hypothetical protein